MQTAAHPQVGVVVPAYQAERWVAATLRSLQAQTLRSWVCVVVDDGSTDGTAEIVRSFVRQDDRIQLLQQPNLGLPAARNVGLAALGESTYVAFLDSDDVYLENALELLVAALVKRPDAVGAFGLAEYVDEDGALLHAGLHPQRQRWRREVRGWRLVLQDQKADATFASMVIDGPVWPPAVAIQRRAAVCAVGGFSASYTALEDRDFYIRLTRLGSFVALDRHIVGYRRHGSNMSRKHEDLMCFLDRARHEAWASPDNTMSQRRLVARAWRLLEARQVLVLGKHVLRSLHRRRFLSAVEAAGGVLLCLAVQLQRGPPPANRRRIRWTRPDDLLDVPL